MDGVSQDSLDGTILPGVSDVRLLWHDELSSGNEEIRPNKTILILA